LNLRPSGYEPDELPGCSTPRHHRRKHMLTGTPVPSNTKGRSRRPLPPSPAGDRKRRFQRAFGRPGSDLLSRVLRRSTISAGAFHGRVRNGIGCSRSAITTRSAKRTLFEKLSSCRHRITRWAWRMRTIKPIELLVPVNFMRCRTSIPGLSTWSSSTALREYSFQGGFPA
jgi:hypothetical protein